MIEIETTSTYSKTHVKRFHNTLEFMADLNLTSLKTLNLGPKNPLSDLMIDNGYDITNTNAN